ncbi:Helicase associated domain protein [Streptomyces sp. NBC_00654]|uniref:DEAD/DEAH box helicase n=1 Tax=Streptomyces sp. NBC_00654 TaxID=2975799 RepID=UPI00225ADDA5|nr:DEAD/DEAH box helicase [Streptomyces sp. NBC_00654]MCX4970555.1 Helicase associated domain protein [Streptomyces sp. NBC_00654]
MTTGTPPGTAAAKVLRPHQEQAVDAITAALEHLPRATVVSACGTGKTIMAAHAALRLAPAGRVLVLVPSVDLLTQTAREWAQTGRRGARIGVYHLPSKDPARAGFDAVTTAPAAIARHVRDHDEGPVTVFATYASLQRLVQAHKQYRLPPWDLVVVDEAHRTCGALTSPWAAIHQDTKVPARRRLYMTATPRVWKDTDRGLGPDTAPAASMDDPKIFGPTVFRLDLPTAISMGILADYEVIVPQINNSELHGILAAIPDGTTADFDRLRLGAKQAMVLRAMNEKKLRSVLVFTSSVRHAEVFARTFATTAAAAPDHLRLANLWTAYVSGRHSPATRRRLIGEFSAHPLAATGRTRARLRRAVMANVNVFREGVDAPAIDAVVFLAPKRSAIAAIQAVGRALRQAPGQGKKATIVVPVYIARGQDVESVLNSSDYRTLWQILQGLRAHDERFRERLEPLLRDLLATVEQPGPDAPERVNEIAMVMGLRMLQPDNGSWGMGLDAAIDYLHTFGHLDIPARYTDDRHRPIGLWITHQRKLHATGNLAPERVEALDHIGMLWKRPANTFDRHLAVATAYARRHGHLAVPTRHAVGGHRLGSWLSAQRHRPLPHAHAQALAALDPYWNPPWSLTWQRAYHLARAQAGQDRGPDTPTDDLTPTGQDLEFWLERQHVTWLRLHPTQRHLLTNIGATPTADHFLRHRLTGRRGTAFHTGLLAAAAHRAREGHLNVPYRYVETSRRQRFHLGRWLSRQRTNRGRLTPYEILALTSLGMVWHSHAPRTSPTAYHHSGALRAA